ncbi:MAG: DUF4249 family protein [Saprospiraceae bacterium]|nr:DUF4249 family protein [Saprospiraceae bacterium]
MKQIAEAPFTGLFLLTVLLVIPLGCLDTIEIDLPQHDQSTRLVIQGVAERSDHAYRFFVEVSKTEKLTDFLKDEREDADIEILYNDQAIISLQNGSDYSIEIDSFHLLYGGSPESSLFNIRVKVGDSTFESISQPIFKVPEGASLKIKYEEREELNDEENVITQPYVKLLVTGPVTNSNNQRVSYRWDVSGVYLFREVIWTLDTSYDPRICYVSDPVSQNQVNIVSSGTVLGDTIRDYEIHETTADHRFATGYYYTVVQKSINEQAANYWKEISNSIDRSGTIYDPPAGIVSTNIRQTAGSTVDLLGFFYTAGVDTIRLLSTRDETGNQPHLCAHKIVSDVCCDCILIRNSTYDKPAYWQ